MKKIMGCLALALLTSACGWQLRGTTAVSKNLSQLYISAASTREASALELMTELRQLLTANHVSLITDSKAAKYALNIIEEKKDKRTVGVGSDALSSAYEITLKVDYEIRSNNELATKATATSVRSFNYNTASIGSAAQEETLLMKEMRRDLAQQMLRRLNATITHSSPLSTTSSEPSNGQTAP